MAADVKEDVDAVVDGAGSEGSAAAALGKREEFMVWLVLAGFLACGFGDSSSCPPFQPTIIPEKKIKSLFC